MSNRRIPSNTSLCHIFHLVLAVFLCHLATNTCYAADDQQKITQAIENFARALRLDPANKSVRKNLAAINARFLLPAAQKVQLFLAEDLLALRDNLQKKIDYFKNKRDALAAALSASDYSPAFLEQKFLEIRHRIILPAPTISEAESLQEPLAALNEFLIREKERLSRELLATQAQFAWLRESLHQQPPVIETAPIEIVITPVPEMPPMPAPAAGPVEQQQITSLRAELNEMRRQFKTLQEDVLDKNERIAALTRQVVEFSLKLAEREIILNQKIDAFGSLTDAYANLESRLELSQKILEEKNGQIRSLQESLAALQTDTAIHTREIKTLMAAKDTALEEWENILAIYQAKLKDATQRIDAGNTAITTLQGELAAVHTKLFEKETALEKTKQKLASLEKQFQSVISDTNHPQP